MKKKTAARKKLERRVERKVAKTFAEKLAESLPPAPGSTIKANVSSKVTESIIAQARAKNMKAHVQPFKFPQHPKGVVPKSKQMAMDDALASPVAWAANGWGGAAFAEGLEFLGYAYLAELSQRPEYRVVSECIATEMTRKWIKFKAVGDVDKTDKIKELEDEFKRLKVQEHFCTLAVQDGFFGRSHLYLDIKDASDDRTELKTPIGDGWNKITKNKIEKDSLERLVPIEAVWIYPTDYNANDPLKTDWYNPNSWFVMGKQLHSSRLLKFIGREVPDLLKPAYSFGGLSMSQMIKPYVDNWLRTRQAVADLVWSFSVSGLKTNLSASLQADGDQLFKRVDLFNALRNNRGALILDKDTEDWFNVQTGLGTLDALQAQTQEHMAAIARIPLVKLLGISPAGLNASSEGEIRAFYDFIGSYQQSFFKPNLHRVVGFAMMNIWGDVDPDITFEFEELWSLDEKGQAEVDKIRSETDTVNIDNGSIDPRESRKRIANDPNTHYQGLNVEDVPERGEEIEESDTDLDPSPKNGAFKDRQGAEKDDE